MGLTVTGVAGLVWNDDAKTCFDCMLQTDELGEIPFTCHQDDVQPHSKEVWDAAMNGDYGSIGNPDLSKAKERVSGEIKRSFMAACQDGKVALSLGWDIDCRRADGVNDIENMMGLLRICEKEQLADTDDVPAPGIRGADNTFHTVTVADLRDTIIPEMDSFGAGLYSHKWDLEQQIDAATTVADVEAITW